MADLESDIIGRVNRLALRPSEKNALLPLMEAVSNSIHSITDLYGADAASKGSVNINIVRQASEDSRIVGFDVEDNGIGFTAENFRSFCTPDSRHKEKRGGKGVGRLAWLKVFESISVESSFFEDGKWRIRAFDFRLSERDQIVEHKDAPVRERHQTIIRFRNFKPNFENKCPVKTGVVENRVAAHFVPLFVAGNAPKVRVADAEISDIEMLFSESIVDQKTDKIDIGEGDEAFPLTVWSLKCDKRMRFQPPAYHFAFIAGDSRSVIDYAMDEQLGLKSLDDEYVYVACASSPYLDQKVNSERTAFTLENSEIDEIKRGIAGCARSFLRDYIEQSLQTKVELTRSIITENPQFLYLSDEVEDFAKSLQPNANRPEDIFLEMSRSRFRRQKKFTGVEKSIKKAEGLDEAISAKIAEYSGFIADEKKGALAEYVTRRKAVLDLYETLLEFKNLEEENVQPRGCYPSIVLPDANRLEGFRDRRSQFMATR